ncbi:MAG: hypothetical protein N2380_01675 [bacterium]|nr:hypothetical protein [bacterium]
MKRVITFMVLSLLLLVSTNLAIAGEVKAYNAGLVIAEDVTEDEDGLIVLDGLFSITTFKKLPGIDNFKVYSRWIGSGKHTIKVQVVDEANNIIMDSDDIALEFDRDNSTYYHYFDFSNIVFTKPGIYWIQALLNGEVDYEIPMFIELEGKELKFKDAPEYPALILSAPAGSVTEKDNGLQVVSGIFEYFAFKRFPSAYDFIIANVWYSGEGGYSQHIEFLDPDGRVIYKSEPQDFEHGPKTVSVVYDKLEDIIFPKAGTYTVKVYLDDDSIFDYPILVVQQ